MPAFSFIHAADLHLDTPYSGIGKVDTRLKEKLRDASLTSFDRLVNAAVTRNVDFVILAGDIYDGIERGVRAQIRFLEGLRRLDRAGIHALFIHGNHDPIEEGWTAFRGDEFPPSTTFFANCDEVRSKRLIRNGHEIAVVHGISFRRKHEDRNLSALFQTIRRDDAFHIGILHTNVGQQSGHSNYAPCSLADLVDSAIDYWALGHIHKRAVLHSENPTILYPGNLQGRGFDECGPRGATLVTVDRQRKVTLEPLVLDTIRFERTKVLVTGCSSLDGVISAFDAAIETAAGDPARDLTVCRVTFEGACEAHDDLLRCFRDGELLATLQDRVPEDRIWVDKVDVDTSPLLDRDKLSGGVGFPSAIIALVDELRENNLALTGFASEVTEPLRKGNRFRNLLPPLDQSLWDQRVRQAEVQLLGLFMCEEDD